MHKKKTGELIKAARVRAGLTQQELADRLKVTQGAIAHWENGRKNMTVETLFDIADALRFPPGFVIDPMHCIKDEEGLSRIDKMEARIAALEDTGPPKPGAAMGGTRKVPPAVSKRR